MGDQDNLANTAWAQAQSRNDLINSERRRLDNEKLAEETSKRMSAQAHTVSDFPQPWQRVVLPQLSTAEQGRVVTNGDVPGDPGDKFGYVPIPNEY